MEGLMMKGPFVAIVETVGSRSYHGPFATSEKASLWIDLHYPHAKKSMIERLGAPKPGWDDTIDPNQTTLDDHITDIHDHVG
jgi:hypothetical protein